MNTDEETYKIYNEPNFVKKFTQQTKDIYNESFYDRIEVLKLFEDLKNKKVLDAGCGAGVYLEWFLSKGSYPTAIDYSLPMLEMVKAKYNNKIPIFKADLREKLNFNTNEFDYILCTMVLLHIKDWTKTFQEFHRILKKDGFLIFSTVHPFADLSDENNYFALEAVSEPWDSYDIVMPSYRRSLTSIFKTIKDTGFTLIDLVEPQPKEGLFANQPWFISFKLKKVSKHE